MFNNINKNLIICIDNNKNYTFICQLKSFIKDCNYSCLKDNKKYFKEKNICVNHCEEIINDIEKIKEERGGESMKKPVKVKFDLEEDKVKTEIVIPVPKVKEA